MAIRTSELGHSPDHPVAVAGGVVFGAFNQRQYLLRLRANGEPLAFNRLGSVEAEQIVDVYEVKSAGLAEPVHLVLDSYAPGPSGVPEGFFLDRADEPWSLPVSIVPADPLAAPSEIDARPRAWQIVGSSGAVFGYAEWDGADAVSIDLPEHTGALMRATLDRFLSITPPAYRGPVLDDVFERYLPLESGGEAMGVPWTRSDVPKAPVPIWGAEQGEQDRGASGRRWPLRRRR